MRGAWSAVLVGMAAGGSAWAAPDLHVDAVTVPAAIVAGQPVRVDAIVDNQGTTDAVDVQVATYASDDAVWDASDPVLCPTQTAARITAGGAWFLHVTCAWPPSLTGTHVLVRATLPPGAPEADPDPSDDVAASAPIALTSRGLANLTSRDLSIDGDAYAGNVVEVGFTMVNDGAYAAPVTRVAAHLSVDGVRDPGDVALCGGLVPALGLGLTRTLSLWGCAIPRDFPAGDAWLLVTTDVDGILWEEDDADDTVALPVEVAPTPEAPDLVLTLALPGEVARGVPFDLPWTVRNAGPVDAPAVDLSVRTSTTGRWDPADDLVCGDQVAALAAGAEASGTLVGCTLPRGVPVGARYLTSHVDGDGEVVEQDEANNGDDQVVVVLPFPRADLVAVAMGEVPDLAVGTVFDVSWEVSNAGEVDAPASRLAAVLSSTPTPAPGDPVLCSAPFAALAAGERRTGTLTGCTVPTGVRGPRAWVVLVVDVNQVVDDAYRDDNTAARRVRLVGDDTGDVDGGDTDTPVTPCCASDPDVVAVDGCGCATTSDDAPSRGAVAAVLGLALAGLRRRRRQMSG
ncbi:MAG: MYXO-CTERM sorting domain-containing protein [Alphaproteobacteria bacterium]|nr:MYXO-CTERM sorting domain-containing protein [Alphaproteobacteria bacterium]